MFIGNLELNRASNPSPTPLKPEMNDIGFLTPHDHNDHYIDDNRPAGSKAFIKIQGQFVHCQWEPVTRRWYRIPQSGPPSINVQQASPPSLQTTPFQYSIVNRQVPVGSYLSVNPNIIFPTISEVQPAAPQFPNRDCVVVSGHITARQLLDYDIPDIQILTSNDFRPSFSAQSNTYYAFINKLIEWKLPENLGDYLNLSLETKFNPVDTDSTLSINVESDALWAARYYITAPVGNVLSDVFRGYNIQCKSESSSIAEVTIDGTSKKILSRVDLCWQLTCGQTYIFAVLEFKRPGCIRADHWSRAIHGQPVGESARFICQQLIKYAYTYNINKVAVCDFNTMILLEIHEDQSKWVGQIQNGTQVAASYRWITDRNEMKRNLYVFLYEAAIALLAKLPVRAS